MTLDIAVQKRLGDFTLDVAFKAPAGVTALFGHSGAGKTSLIRAVAGLLTPDSGVIRIGDSVLHDSARRIDLPVHRRRIGYVFQDARLFPHMTVRRNLHYGGQHDSDRVIGLLGLGGLLDRYPATLSGGERQRVALGRALMCDPQLLLMDEPLAALDSPRKAEIMPYLEQLRDSVRVPILYVSHAISEVARLATTLVVLRDGKAVRAGPVGDLLSDPAGMGVLGARDAGAVIVARCVEYNTADGLSTLSFSGGRIVVPGRAGPLGQFVRLRVPAHDVILSRQEPAEISALNVLPVTVTGVEIGHGPGVAVGLLAGQDKLLARITQRSLARLNVQPGDQIFAILKATAVSPDDIGEGGADGAP